MSPARMRFRPLPGTATEADVLDVRQRYGLLCELVEGVLVEKLMGFRESFLTIALSRVSPRAVSAISDASEEAGGTPALPGCPPEAAPAACVQPAMTQDSGKMG